MTNIRTKIIEGKQTILLVDGLPENKANEFKFGGMWLNMVRWKFISTIENLSEYEADGLVDRVAQHYQKYGYSTIADCWTDTAIESFHSLLKANDVLMENPYNEPWRDDAYPPLWQEAEAKVFKSSTTLIFVKDS